MIQVGTIQQLWRHPIKGVAGEQLESSAIGPDGIDGDRVWALWDKEREEIQSCKYRPALLRCRATLRPDRQVDVVFPDGSRVGSDDAAIHHKFSELVGHPSRLEQLRSEAAPGFFRRYKAEGHDWRQELAETFTREPGEPLPDIQNLSGRPVDFVTIPGTFFLVSPLHVVTTATMEHFKNLLPQADWDIRRFRPNIVIETLSSLSGLVEQEWIGHQLVVGDARFSCTETAPRCGAVTRQLEELERDTSMLRTIVKKGDQNLGIYAELEDAHTLKVGDPVFLARSA